MLLMWEDIGNGDFVVAVVERTRGLDVAAAPLVAAFAVFIGRVVDETGPTASSPKAIALCLAGISPPFSRVNNATVLSFVNTTHRKIPRSTLAAP